MIKSQGIRAERNMTSTSLQSAIQQQAVSAHPSTPPNGSPVNVTLQALQDSIACLSDTVAGFLRVLEPVLMPPPPEAQSTGESYPQAPSPLCEALFEHDLRVRNINARLQDALRRITL